MQRTRKWAYLATEAKRLAGQGLSPTAIAAALGVNRSTVHRWMVKGQLEETRGTRVVAAPMVIPLAPAPTWAEAVRTAAVLDATDEEIVQLATFALSVTQDPREPTPVRLAAAGRFQSLVKQLASHIRPTVEELVPAPAPPPTVRIDPRAQLMSIQ